ncbi:hypothetical protein FRC06_003441, partial [Ceratobasidium sp. 370]
MLRLQAAKPTAELCKHYWKTGTTSILASDIEKAKNLDPTTLPQDFHLTPAFAPITSDPMDPLASGTTPSPTDIYKRHFKTWCEAFRGSRAVDGITIRFYAGDADTFCRALDTYLSTGSAPTHLFTSARYANFINSDELTASATTLKYDIIETSNLMDPI